MIVLLDTHVLLWYLSGDRRLGAQARRAIVKAADLVVSDISRWEISMKVAGGKLAPIPGLRESIDALGARRLDLREAHLKQLETLPLLHRDPFDRALIAQAMAEGMPVLTSDRHFAAYDVRTIDARE